jgi:hypothetical protein
VSSSPPACGLRDCAACHGVPKLSCHDFRVCVIVCCVQSVYEDVARDTNRGHTVEAVKECFCQAKDAGFKVRCCKGFGADPYGFNRQDGLLLQGFGCRPTRTQSARWALRYGALR